MVNINSPPLINKTICVTPKKAKMKNTLLAVAGILILCNAACKKEDNRQYSSWYVNEEPFSTNDVKTDIGKAVAYLNTNSKYSGGTAPNGFSIIFNTGSLGGGFPTSGQIKLDCSQQNPQWACMSILYNEVGYIPKEIDSNYINASSANSKARYTLKSTWFYNASNALDSVLVRGTFNQP